MRYEEAIALTEKRAAAVRFLKANAKQFNEQMAAKVAYLAHDGKENKMDIERFEPAAPAVTLGLLKKCDGVSFFYGEDAAGKIRAGCDIVTIADRPHCYRCLWAVNVGEDRKTAAGEQVNVSFRECKIYSARKLADLADALGFPGTRFELVEKGTANDR